MKSWLFAFALVLLSCSAGGGGTRSEVNDDNEDAPFLGGGGMAGLGIDAPRGAEPIDLSNLCDPCTFFPAEPILDAGAPADAASRFTGDGAGTGPCIAEPEDGALFPANWWRPRIRVTGATGALKQIVLSTARETNDLVAYTTADVWTLPEEIWQGISANVFEEDIQVTVSVEGAGSSMTRFRIAPVNTGGSMVYWASDDVDPGDTSWLVGFGVGEEGYVDALRINDVTRTILGDDGQNPKRAEFGVSEGQIRCIGCHTSTPDGDAVAFNDHWPWNAKIASVREEDRGARPAWMTDGGEALLQAPWLGMFTFSKGDWDTGARRTITSWAVDPSGSNWGCCQNTTGRDTLVWFDLATTVTLPPSGPELAQRVSEAQGTAWGELARNGDNNAAVAPNWSHDGARVAYTSTPSTLDGHVGENADSNIYVVPFNGGAGGDAVPLDGAAQAGVAEYYPAFSADDAFVAFNRAGTSGSIFYRPDSEVYVVSSQGGAPIRLAANDPSACTGTSSPGVVNSWPKWSPSVQTALGRTYYFLIFSSIRDGLFDLPRNQYSPPVTTASQLYITAIVVEGDQVQTYPSIYIWNQTTDTTNLTPAWDEFQIPPATIR